jgi:2-dehydropantoate 2-reductase
MDETIAVARALDIVIPIGLEDQIWSAMTNFPPHGRASTAIDLEHGRPLEVEWISGAVVRLAGKAGVDVPLNAALYALLLPYKDGAPKAKTGT